MDDPTPRASRQSPLVIAGVVFALLLVMAVVATIVIPLLQEQPFDSVDELDPENIKSLRVYFLNRKELDGGDDIGPYFAAEEDFAKLLAPLRKLPEVQDFQDTRGVWLGEYRVRTKTGRKGTIKLYWVKTPLDPPSAPARLRFQIGPHKFEGGTAVAIITAANEAATRGSETPR